MLEDYKGATREERFQIANTELLENINVKLSIIIDLLKTQNATPAVITEEKVIEAEVIKPVKTKQKKPRKQE